MTRGGLYARSFALCAAVLLTGILPGSTVSSRVPGPDVKTPDIEQQNPARAYVLSYATPDVHALVPEPVRVAVTVGKGDTLMALLERLGCAVTDLGILPDQAALIRASIFAAADGHDLLLTSGGVSCVKRSSSWVR